MTSSNSLTTRTKTMSAMLGLLLSLVLAVVGWELDKMLEVDMYGSRPGESLVVPASNDYYKYVEMSEGWESTTPPQSPQSGGTTAGSSGETTARQGRTQGRTQGHKHNQEVGGSCYSCSTLEDKTGLCRDIATYISRKQNNESGLPVLETACSKSARYCQVMRVDYKVDNMSGYAQWSLERSCSERCEPFCVTMGGRTKVTYCTSCCRWDGSVRDREGRLRAGESADNCNVGNIARSLGGTSSTFLLNTLWLLLVSRL